MRGMSVEETSKRLKGQPGPLVEIIGFFQIIRIPDIACLSGMYMRIQWHHTMKKPEITAASVSYASLYLLFTLLCSLLAFIAILLGNLSFQKFESRRATSFLSKI